ncbi:MAG: Hpt domain-containing protein [Azoarcus sp.]|jgi:chemosensory pili system protein ChpA (sensor histidine kinase/response regulator)|nr:Hpt domain-containing protein [Azoarcus sp.]
MTQANEPDLGPLSWVRSEIDQALTRAADSLKLAVEPVDGSAKVQFAQTHLHQVNGALSIIGLDGLTKFVAALDLFFAALVRGELSIDEDRIKLGLRALSSIGNYLDDLIHGAPDQPLRLLPLYRELVLARGEATPSPADLFFPDLSVRIPRRSGTPEFDTMQRQHQRRTMRLRFQRGLLDWLRHPDADHTDAMRAALAGLEISEDSPGMRALWWAGQAFVDTLTATPPEDLLAAKHLLSRLEAQLRHAGDGSQVLPERLLREMLYNIARQPASTPIQQAAHKAWGLDALIPEEGSVVSDLPLAPLLQELHTRLTSIKEEWNTFGEQGATALSGFTAQLEAFTKSTASLGRPVLYRLLGGMCRFVKWLSANPQRYSEPIALEFATALLLAETALDRNQPDPGFQSQVGDALARLESLARGEEVNDTPSAVGVESARKHQEKEALAQVSHEILSSLATIEQTLDDFFRDNAKRAPLENLSAPLHQIEGALAILGETDAITLIRDAGETIARLAKGDSPADDAELVELAHHFSALGFFIQSLQYSRTSVSHYLQPQAPAAPRQEAEIELPDLPEIPAVHPAPEQATPASPAPTDGIETFPTFEIETGEEAEIAVTLEPPPSIPPVAPEVRRLAEAPKEELDAELLCIFIEEAREVLEAVATRLEQLRIEPSNRGYLTDIRRSFHTLKGSGRMVGLSDLGEAAWGMEQTLNRWLQLEWQVTPALLQLVSGAYREFLAWVTQIEGNAGYQRDVAALLAEAERLRNSDTPIESPVSAQAAAPKPLESLRTPEQAATGPTASGQEDLTETVLDVPDIVLEAGDNEPDFTRTQLAPDDIAFEIEGIDLVDLDETEPADAAPPAKPDAARDQARPNDDVTFEFDDIGFTPPSETGIASGKITFRFENDGAPATEPKAVHEQTAPEEVTFELEDIDFELGTPETTLAPGAEPEASGTDASEPAEEVTFELEDIDFELGAPETTLAPSAESEISETDVNEPVEEVTFELEDAGLEPEMPEATPASSAEPEISETDVNEPATPNATSSAVPRFTPFSFEPFRFEPFPSFDTDETPDESGESNPSVTSAPLRTEPESDTLFIGGTEISKALFDLYVTEAQMHINTLHQEFDHLGVNPTLLLSEAALRAAHSCAGISGTAHCTPLYQLGKALEHAQQWLHDHQRAPTDNELALFRSSANTLDAMLTEVIGLRMPLAAPELIEQLDRVGRAPIDSEAAPRVSDDKAIVEAATKIFPEAARAALAPKPAIPDSPLPVVHDEIDEQLLPIFLEEAGELLSNLHSTLHTWNSDLRNAEHAKLVKRYLHTLKGSARMAGAMTLGNQVHQLESRVESALTAEQDVPALIDEIASALDTAEQTIGILATGSPEHEAPTAIPATPASAPAEEAEAVTPAKPATVATPTVPPVILFPGGKPSATPVAATAQVAEGEATNVALRVRADLIDNFVNDASEIGVARTRIEGELRNLHRSMLDLTENVIRLRNQLREIELQADVQMQTRIAQAESKHAEFDPLEMDRYTRLQELTRMMAESVNDVTTVQQTLLKNLDSADFALHSQARTTRELQQALMQVRMVPFDSLAVRLYRIVRQSAKELGKRANLDIRGGGIEIDRSVLDHIVAPLEHLLRNSLAHGIESPEVRRNLGKPEIGQITLTARQEGNEIVIELADDGAGLNFARISERARQRGLLGPIEVADERRLTNLIFVAGFSTAEQVSTVSGRGVGMDVVKAETAAVGGRIDVATTPGSGTLFSIFLPLTLAVTQALLVRSGNQHYAIPASMISQIVELKANAVEHLRTEGSYEWQGQQYAYHYLANLLGDRSVQPEIGRYSWVLLLHSGSQTLALHVDALRGHQEIIVKNAGPQLTRIVGMSGATVLGNGEIVLIINPVAMVSREIIYGQTAVPVTSAPALPPHEPTVMVVDDSLTVRKITTRMLEREGYRVITAKDGVDAIETLIDDIPDVILSDIEMPRMDGFEFVRNLRADTRLRKVPVIMITSRLADKHRDYAMEIGANHYLGKPYQEDELLGLIASYTHRS